MQTFGGVLTMQQIRDLAAFILQATHRCLPLDGHVVAGAGPGLCRGGGN
jgi:hypothetical protein